MVSQNHAEMWAKYSISVLKAWSLDRCMRTLKAVQQPVPRREFQQLSVCWWSVPVTSLLRERRHWCHQCPWTLASFPIQSSMSMNTCLIPYTIISVHEYLPHSLYNHQCPWTLASFPIQSSVSMNTCLIPYTIISVHEHLPHSLYNHQCPWTLASFPIQSSVSINTRLIPYTIMSSHYALTVTTSYHRWQLNISQTFKKLCKQQILCYITT